jgi:hypothetical protein
LEKGFAGRHSLNTYQECRLSASQLQGTPHLGGQPVHVAKFARQILVHTSNLEVHTPRGAHRAARMRLAAAAAAARRRRGGELLVARSEAGHHVDALAEGNVLARVRARRQPELLLVDDAVGLQHFAEQILRLLLVHLPDVAVPLCVGVLEMPVLVLQFLLFSWVV